MRSSALTVDKRLTMPVPVPIHYAVQSTIDRHCELNSEQSSRSTFIARVALLTGQKGISASRRVAFPFHSTCLGRASASGAQ